MTITTYDNLQKWFLDSKGSKPAPLWNLYAITYGRSDQVVHRNVEITDLEKSAEHLENTIRMFSDTDGAPPKFKLSVYAVGQPNNPTATIEVQIRPSNYSNPQMAGIGSLPMAGYVSIGELEHKLENERLKWKVQLLEDQMNAPSEKWERVVEHLSNVPGIDKVIQALAIGVVSKVNPAALPAVQAAMNGTPDAGEHEADGSEDPNVVFMQNAHEAANGIGVDPVTMMKQINKLVRSNPEMARQLMQQ